MNASSDARSVSTKNSEKLPLRGVHHLALNTDDMKKNYRLLCIYTRHAPGACNEGPRGGWY